jgi:hypothetical protein
MVTRSKKRKSTGSKKRFIGKPAGQIQERVQAVGPEHFGIVAVFDILADERGLSAKSELRIAN